MMTSCWEVKKQIALVGDRGCGKTSLAVRISSDMFLDCYLPTQFVDDFTAEVDMARFTCKLTLLDLSGSYENENIRSLVYNGCDAVVLCFDLTDSSSLESVESKWLPELEENCPGVPFILAGCKRDVMCDGPEGCVCGGACCTRLLNETELAALILRTRAKAYIECSARTMDGVQELARLGVEVAQKKRKVAKRFASSIMNSKLLRKLSLF